MIVIEFFDALDTLVRALAVWIVIAAAFGTVLVLVVACRQAVVGAAVVGAQPVAGGPVGESPDTAATRLRHRRLTPNLPIPALTAGRRRPNPPSALPVDLEPPERQPQPQQ